MTPEEYWTHAPGAMRNMNPGPDMEGFNRVDWIEAELLKANMMPGVIKRPRLFEFGCGDGEFMRQVKSPRWFDEYVGMDINNRAVCAAQKEFPGVRFYHAGLKEAAFVSERSGIALAYQVLLHIDDEEILPTIQALCHAPTVVVCEILGTEWRRPGMPPVFNRALEEYFMLFRMADKELVHQSHRPYAYYQGKPIAKGKNTDISMLVFQ